MCLSDARRKFSCSTGVKAEKHASLDGAPSPPMRQPVGAWIILPQALLAQQNNFLAYFDNPLARHLGVRNGMRAAQSTHRGALN